MRCLICLAALLSIFLSGPLFAQEEGGEDLLSQHMSGKFAVLEEKQRAPFSGVLFDEYAVASFMQTQEKTQLLCAAEILEVM